MMKYKGAGSQHKVQLGMSYSEDLNLSAQSDQSLSFQPEETLDPWLPIESDCADVQADLS